MDTGKPKWVTLDLIERLKTPKGGYKRRDLEAIGIPWPLVTGWKQRAIGQPIRANPGKQGLLLA